MRAILAISCLVWALPGLGGCIIGTWPTPEAQKTGVAPGRDPLGDEACNGVDDDGDGSYDEGCACEAHRGCVGVEQGQCGPGVQYCVDGIWQECDDIGLPRTAVRVPSIEIVNVEPTVMVRGQATGLTVVVEPMPACDAFEPPPSVVNLVTATPVMRVSGEARDDGVAPDVTAGDGLFSVQLPIPFGPGIAAQAVKLEASVQLSNALQSASVDASFEEAP